MEPNLKPIVIITMNSDKYKLNVTAETTVKEVIEKCQKVFNYKPKTCKIFIKGASDPLPDETLIITIKGNKFIYKSPNKFKRKKSKETKESTQIQPDQQIFPFQTPPPPPDQFPPSSNPPPPGDLHIDNPDQINQSMS